MRCSLPRIRKLGKPLLKPLRTLAARPSESGVGASSPPGAMGAGGSSGRRYQPTEGEEAAPAPREVSTYALGRGQKRRGATKKDLWHTLEQTNVAEHLADVRDHRSAAVRRNAEARGLDADAIHMDFKAYFADVKLLKRFLRVSLPPRPRPSTRLVSWLAHKVHTHHRPLDPSLLPPCAGGPGAAAVALGAAACNGGAQGAPVGGCPGRAGRGLVRPMPQLAAHR